MKPKPCNQNLCVRWKDCPFKFDTCACKHSLDVNADELLNRFGNGCLSPPDAV